MSFFDKILNAISDWANNANESYEQEIENMKYKTDEQLMNIVKSGSSARAIGKRKAALEELRNRGIVKK